MSGAERGPRDEIATIVARVLDPADAGAARLWEYLARVCFFDRPLPTDPVAMQRAEGKRELFIDLARLASRPLRFVKE